MKKIKEITALDTFSVRHPVLRNEKSIETCHFDGDDLPSTKHFGLFVDEKLTAVVSVFKNKNVIFNIDNQFQIRGMAVLNEFQKKGFGQDLVAHCELFVKSQNGELIWFNARENATDFYKKLDYEIVGNVFEIANVGHHYIMKKRIG
jgi:predicted GNAT family N-acyltransferase